MRRPSIFSGVNDMTAAQETHRVWEAYHNALRATRELWDSIPEAPIEWSDCDEFTQAYIVCALWSSTDDTDTPMDENYYPDDISCETLGQMIRDCQRFQEIALYLGYHFGMVKKHAGQDFWLTRNNHGAGFWDGDWQDEAGEKLTALSHSFGECNLYTHEGRIYL